MRALVRIILLVLLLPQAALAKALFVVVLDPGHGGTDLGAVSSAGTREKDITLAIARAAARALGQVPHTRAILTREDDTSLALESRMERAAYEGAQAFVSIHINASPRPQARGFTVLFLQVERVDEPGDPSACPADPPQGLFCRAQRTLAHRQSALLASLVHDRLARLWQGPSRGIKQGNLRMLRSAPMAAILVELDFITTPAAEALLLRRETQDRAGRALAQGLEAYRRSRRSVVEN